MGHGGKRPGAGRKPGSLTKKTRQIAELAVVNGQTPLEFMLEVMRDNQQDMARRERMCLAAAQYLHPKLSALMLDLKDIPYDDLREAAR